MNLPNGGLSCVHCCSMPVQQYRIKNRSGVMGKLEPGLKLSNPKGFKQRATRTRVLGGECTIVRCRTGQKNCQCSNLGCQQNLKSPVAHWQEHVFSPIETLQCDGDKIFKVFKFCQFWLTFPKMLLACMTKDWFGGSHNCSLW